MCIGADRHCQQAVRMQMHVQMLLCQCFAANKLSIGSVLSHQAEMVVAQLSIPADNSSAAKHQQNGSVAQLLGMRCHSSQQPALQQQMWPDLGPFLGLDLLLEFVLQLCGLLLLGSNLLRPHVDLVASEVHLHKFSHIL